MSKVFVLDTLYRPVDPVHPGYARKLLTSGKAAVFRRYPFTIILKREGEQSVAQSLRLKLDPGSKTTGLAIVNDATGEVVWGAELTHRGQAIKAALDSRRAIRRSRRKRKTRYRQSRFGNRRRKEGWLPPSLVSRIATIETWVHRLMRFCPVQVMSQELVKFDMQSLDSPEITGVKYQQGDLAGYEVKEYLLEKWGRSCAYCGTTDVPLQVEHIHARANGGTDRVSNLTLACEFCNQQKGKQNVKDFLKEKPDVLSRLLTQARVPLKDASAVNATRWAIYERLQRMGVPVECGTGGRTKYNRVSRGLNKTHWIDAACVGASTPAVLYVENVTPLFITATGHGCRQMCVMNASGFPRSRPKARHKSYLGFQTGDTVKASVPTGKYKGTHEGRVAIRFRPSFRLNGFDVHPRYLKTIHRSDGYRYEKGASHSSQLQGVRVPATI